MLGSRSDLGLGFSFLLRGAAVPAILLLFAAAFVLVARRRWRLAAVRREEVRRLARLAAAEAARAEMEAAALAYVLPPAPMVVEGGGWRPPPPMQCAVCYCPTTTRCSQCKAVRYCSGKCQIIHWRQGHKDECRPPRIDDHYSGQESVSNLKCVEAEQSDLCDNTSEIEGKLQSKPVETLFERQSSVSSLSSGIFSEDSNHEPKPSVDSSGTESTSDSLADSSSSLSSSSFTFCGPVESSDDVYNSEDPHIFDYAEMSKASGHDIPVDDPSNEVNASEMNLTEVSPSELASASLSVNNLSCTSNSEKKVSTCKTDVDCRSSSLSASSSIVSDNCANAEPLGDCGECSGDHGKLVAGSTSNISSNLSTSGTKSAREDSVYRSNRTDQLESNARPNYGNLATSSLAKSGFVSSEKNDDVRLLRAKSLRLPSSISSVNCGSSSDGSHSVSSDLASKTDNVSMLHTKPSENSGLVPNGIDLKTSVKRAVQQLKSSQLSKNHSSAPRSIISLKYKMIFPYDHFVKLYNCDKVELRPCGFTNCGNSCYANAVLQCLAFTRPLASYLLQGLHDKTCPKREWCFTCELGNILVKAKLRQSPLSPIGILSHIRNIGSNLDHGREEDAHEFLRYAIDTMQSVCLKEAGVNTAGRLAEETTLVQLIFGGYLRSKIKCTRCRGKSERHERMMDLTVEIHGDIGTLEDALSRFTSTEILDGENKYNCNRCKSYERAKKKLTVLEAPNVLTIALKRFQSGKFGKLNKSVRFPEHLDLAPYMSRTDDKSPVYSLYAVVVHQDIMNAAFSGHYICYVKSTQGKWYKTDDSKVKPVDVGRVLAENAYMLLYARCSPRAPSFLRSSISHDHPKTKRNKCKDSLLSGHAPPVVTQLRSQDPPYRPYSQQHASSQRSDFLNERLPFPRVDSSSETSSLFSCSDEGSWSTESTRDSTSTEEFSEYIFGGSGRYSWNSASSFSEDSDGSVCSPLISRHSFAGEEESVSYGERLGWERKEEAGLEGRESPQFLCSDTSSQCRKLTGDCRGRESDRGVEGLMRRSSTTRERRDQTFY